MSGPAATEATRIENDIAVFERDPDGFVKITAKRIDHDLAQAEFCSAFTRTACAELGRRVRLLVDMREARSISRDARIRYANADHANAVVGTALLIDSGISRVLGNFVMALNKVVAIRLFTDEPSARAWLDSLDDRDAR